MKPEAVKLRHLPGTRASQLEMLHEMRQKARSGRVRTMVVAWLDQDGVYGASYSGMSAKLERVGLLQAVIHAELDE